MGVGFLDHTLAYEVLAQGCPSTALAFNMHASVVMPLLESAEVSTEAKRCAAAQADRRQFLRAGHYITDRREAVEGGYRVTGRKMFASMPEAADFVLVMAYPDGATSPSAGIRVAELVEKLVAQAQ